jgi:hypothetical protein
MVSRRTFATIKDRLIEMGLIDAHSHLWNEKTHLWIKPTEQLSRIVFEPGYWETVRDLYAFVPVKKKPRGIHVKKAVEPVPGPTNISHDSPKNCTSLPPIGKP